jgi:hypothetical protein
MIEHHQDSHSLVVARSRPVTQSVTLFVRIGDASISPVPCVGHSGRCG